MNKINSHTFRVYDNINSFSCLHQPHGVESNSCIYTDKLSKIQNVKNTGEKYSLLSENAFEYEDCVKNCNDDDA